MALRGTVQNFQFFLCAEPGSVIDPGAAGITGDSVDTKGFETLMFQIGFGCMSLGSVADHLHLTMEHASNSTTGPNVIGAWSAVSGLHVFGLDKGNLLSSLTYASWQLLDDATRASYPISVQPGWHDSANSVSGRFMYVGGSVTSQTDWGSQLYEVGYRGNHRWVRVTISGSGDISISDCTIVAICGLPGDWPVSEYGHTVEN